MWFRRRWCPYGERPPWVYAERYQWLWVYAAVRPATGESFVLLLPGVDARCLQAFLDAFAAQVAGRRVGLVLDGAGAHGAEELAWPAGIAPVSLPPYSPELNPAERLFEHLRARLANRVFADLEELTAALTAELRRFWDEPTLLRRLTGYPWWAEASDTIAPSAS